MRYLLAAIAALLISCQVRSQSDYGWFTGKADFVLGADGSAGVSCHYIYNFADRLSLGAGAGALMSEPGGSCMAPVTAMARLGLCGRHSRLMPVLDVRGGCALCAGGLYAEERLALETTRIRRVRWSVGLGIRHARDWGRSVFAGVGILF